MTFLENHHLWITIIVCVFILSLAGFGLYLARGNPLAIGGVVSAAVTGLTGVHAGTSAVAANPNTQAYGSTAHQQAPPPPPAPPHQ